MTMKRIELWRERPNRKTGTQTCTECGKGQLPMLFEGGLCAACYLPEPITDLPYKKSYVTAAEKPQLPESDQLIKKVLAHLKEYSLTRREFAIAVGITHRSLNFWLLRRMKENGQRRTVAVVKKYFKKLEAVA